MSSPSGSSRPTALGESDVPPPGGSTGSGSVGDRGWVARKVAALDRWIDEEYRLPARSLAAYRIGYALLLLVAAFPALNWIADYPGTAFRPPPGPFYLLPGLPPLWVLVVTTVALSASATALLVGWRTKAASLSTALLLTVAYAFAYAFGKVNHTILLALVPLVLAWSGWGDHWSLDARRRGAPPPERTSGWPLALLALLVGLLLFSAALPKITSGWLDPSTQAVRGHLLRGYLVHERDAFLAPLAAGLRWPPLWELLDWATVGLEGAFLLAPVRRRWFVRLCAVAVLFHLGVFLMMNIAFTVNVFAYGAFVDWWRLRRRVPAALRRGAARVGRAITAPAAVAIAGVHAAVVVAVGRPLLAVEQALGISRLEGILVHPITGVAAAAFLVAELRRRAGRPLPR